MRTIIRKLMIAILALMPATMVLAQASAPAMPEAVSNLNRFNGNWEANLTSIMGDKSYQVDYNVMIKPVAGGNGSYWEEKATQTAMGDWHSSDLFGYDRTDGKLHDFSVDNMGSTHDRIADWKSPDHLVLTYNGIENGKQVAEVLDFTLQSDNMIEFIGKSTIDGKSQWSGTGTFHKTEDR